MSAEATNCMGVVDKWHSARGCQQVFFSSIGACSLELQQHWTHGLWLAASILQRHVVLKVLNVFWTMTGNALMASAIVQESSMKLCAASTSNIF